MSDGPLDGTTEGPARKPTPWSVRKIVEQVTGKPLESMQDPPGTRRAPRSSSPSSPRDPPLERYHEDGGSSMAVLVERAAPAPRTSLETVEDEKGERAEREERLATLRERSPRPLESREDRSPSLRAFLPGTPPVPSSGRSSRPASLPLTRPLPLEVVEEVERLREEENAPQLPVGEGPHHKRTELERVYLSYLLMHLDKLTEPALKYLQHAVEEECEERGLKP